MKWIRSTAKRLAPAWLQRVAAKYPKTVGLVVVILIILPFSPVTFGFIHLITWMFTIK